MNHSPTLADYIDAHKGETAWLFGKGPSITGFDMRKAGTLRCAINDVVSVVPDCKYCFANDSVRDWSDLYQQSHTLFTPRRTMNDWFLKPVKPKHCTVVIYDDEHDDRRLLLDKPSLAQSMAIRRGTLGSAVQILHLMGVARIETVGIDGGQCHAVGSWRTRLRNDHWRDYNAIRDQFVTTCDLLGIELVMHGKTLRRNGKMRVQFTKNCFVRDIAYREGDIADVSLADANLLYHAEAAIRVKEVVVNQVVDDDPLSAPPAEPLPAIKQPRKRKAKAA